MGLVAKIEKNKENIVKKLILLKRPFILEKTRFNSKHIIIISINDYLIFE